LRRIKLAFLFMVYDRLNFPQLWHRFFVDAAPADCRVLVHASQQNAVGQSAVAGSEGELADADVRFFRQFEIAWRPSAWFNISLVLIGLLHAALQDPAVGKAVVLSGDTVPLATFPQIHSWASADQERSWLCIDHEFTRSEPWVLLTRRHMQALMASSREMLQLLDGSGMCDAEELVLQALYLLGEASRIRDRCVVFTQWALPKYFAVGRGPAVLGRPPALLGDFERQVGACGHPTTFEHLPAADIGRLLESAGPVRNWFARKFARRAVVGDIGNGEEEEELQMHLLARLYGGAGRHGDGDRS